MGKVLKKEDLNKFLYKIKTKQELVAPVKTDVIRFEPVKYVSQITLEKNAQFPPKKYLMPAEDDMFSFKDAKITLPKKPPYRVIFGMRLCDVGAIDALDRIFLNKDLHYTQRRERTTIIGVHCIKEIEKNCFCTSQTINNTADLFFYDIGDSYYIEVGSDKGLKLVSRLKDFVFETENIKTKKRLEKKDLLKYYNNSEWEKAVKKCTSCGICTSICPTCLCHSFEDKTGLEPSVGKRVRKQISCLNNGFWKNHDNSPIETTKSFRYKHFVYHKLHYFKKKHDIDMCTGCGRCINYCPEKIDFVKIVNNLK